MAVPSVNLSSDYESLGRILDELGNRAEVKASKTLQKQIQDARNFYNDAQAEIDALLKDNRALAQELLEIRHKSGVSEAGSALPVERYAHIRDAGGQPDLIYRVAKADGLDDIDSLKLLRKLFNYSLEEARRVVDDAERAPQTPR